MTCVSSCDESTVINVIRGSDREITIRIETKKSQEPFDLTGVSEIEACFLKEDDTILSKKMTTGGVSVVSALAGKIKVILTETDTATLKVGESRSFEVLVTIGSVTSIVQFIEQLNVIKRVCV